MAQRSRVPKFGDWGGGDSVPYTAYFDKARKDKSGTKVTNPNDPEQNLDAFSEDPEASAAASPLRRVNREATEPRRQTDSSGHHDSPAGRRMTDSPHQRHGGRGNSGEAHRRGNRENSGSERSIEHSPLHPHYQARVASKGGVSSSPERKGSSESGHGPAPTRSRLRPASRGEETPDRGSAVPRFGDWDESDPASADGYSHIFNKVREEKQIGSAKVPAMPTNTSYSNGLKQDSGQDFKKSICCCFPPRGRK